MRISNSPIPRSGSSVPGFKIPLEVQLWLNRGWVIIPTERKGVVLSGRKTMRKRDKIFFGLGTVAMVLFAAGFHPVGVAGVLLIVLASLDYWGNTAAPTKFFPAEGDAVRTLER